MKKFLMFAAITITTINANALTPKERSYIERLIPELGGKVYDCYDAVRFYNKDFENRDECKKAVAQYYFVDELLMNPPYLHEKLGVLSWLFQYNEYLLWKARVLSFLPPNQRASFTLRDKVQSTSPQCSDETSE